ncbi:MAG: hypothetical protein ACYS30_23240 [Planctomycetota bacterium]|jgi:peptidoglycan hydrolase CwlO-like protein
MSALGALATGAVKAMVDVLISKHGKGAKTIRKLKKELIGAEKKIAKLRDNIAILLGQVATRDSQIKELKEEIDYWCAKYFELVEIAKQPPELDDNPFDESENNDD